MKKNEMSFRNISLPAVICTIAVVVLSAKACEVSANYSSIFVAACNVIFGLVVFYLAGIFIGFRYAITEKGFIVAEVCCLVAAAVLYHIESTVGERAITVQITADILIASAAMFNGIHIFMPFFSIADSNRDGNNNGGSEQQDDGSD